MLSWFSRSGNLQVSFRETMIPKLGCFVYSQLAVRFRVETFLNAK